MRQAVVRLEPADLPKSLISMIIPDNSGIFCVLSQIGAEHQMADSIR